jgi:hypothetical protein
MKKRRGGRPGTNDAQRGHDCRDGSDDDGERYVLLSVTQTKVRDFIILNQFEIPTTAGRGFIP